ncbi:MAG: ATP-binding protein [Cytophagales bacterium]|nr:ATP-binding protein [Cytophagales bacterium]
MKFKLFADKYLNKPGAGEERLFVKKLFIIMLLFPAVFSFFILSFWRDLMPSSIINMNVITLVFYMAILFLLVFSRFQLDTLLFWAQIILITTWFVAVVTLPESSNSKNWINELILVFCLWLDGLFVIFLSLFSSSTKKVIWVFAFYISTIVASLLLHPWTKNIPDGIPYENVFLFAINIVWIATIVLFPIFFFIKNRTKIAQQKEANLRELDKAKSALFTNITHEFRTPLTVISGTAGLIKEMPGIETTPQLREKLATIERNNNRLLHLVDQMLDMALVDNNNLSLKPIQADVAAFLKSIADNFKSYAESKNLKLTTYAETERIVMDFDPDQLYKVVSNLLTNAIKFTPKNGQIIYHFKKDEINSELVVRVIDTGVGISTRELPRIFDRFYQVEHLTTDKTDGTGIGLSLTRDLVELMQGSITAKSKPGEGSVFEVRIPITTMAKVDDVSPIKKTECKELHPSGIQHEQLSELNTTLTDPGKQLILIVEDNVDLARIIAKYFRGKFNTIFAKNGQEGIIKAIEHIPDMIISDVLMPEKNGYELCQFLKKDERTSHIPIVLLTAKSTEQDKLTGLAMGADAYLVKPFNKAELFIRIDSLIALRKRLKQKYESFSISNLRKKGSLEDTFLEKVIKKIDSEISNPKLNNLELARAMKLSESQLFRKLKALTGKSPSAFIRYIRLLRAKEQLGNSEMNVAEVAYETGFNDPAWFSRAFKQEFGYSPSEFKQKNSYDAN